VKKLAAVLLFTLALCVFILNVPTVVVNSLPKAKIAQLKEIEYAESVSAKGEVSKKDSKTVEAPAPMVISKILVKKGDKIKSGQAIAEVDRSATAKKIMTSGQYSSFLSGKSVSSYDEILSLVPSQVKSDFSGIVESVNAERGNFLSEGDKIISLIGSDAFVVKASVSENYISKIKVGQSAVITGNGFEGEYSGTVEEIASEAKKEYVGTTEDTVVEVKIRFNDADENIRPGYSAKVKIFTSEPKKIKVVPYEAVMQDENNNEYVYVFNNGIAVKKDIKTGAELSEGIEIADGLSGNENILSPSDNIKDGQYVKLEGEN
jgi:multidrug efflux pump subunit AcrA (membrane-fusion protein)